MCPLYVAGLIGPGDRRVFSRWLAPGDYDQLPHFVSQASGTRLLETELLVQADKLVGGSNAVLVIDDTAIAEKGTLVIP
jgi:DDE superfamily endonuclease